MWRHTPLAAAMAAKVERQHAAMAGKLRRDRVPPVRICSPAVQQQDRVLARVATPIDVMQPEAADFDEVVAWCGALCRGLLHAQIINERMRRKNNPFKVSS